jgi:hypothetical protein
MKALLVVAAGLLAATAVAGAQGVTKPGQTRTEEAQIVALSVTGRSVTYAVADNASKSDCAHAYVWRTAGGATGKWRFGKATNEPCVEGLSTGDGISAVAMSAERSLWIQYAGGNLRDWQLFTATSTKTKPRQLAFVEQDVDLPSPIVVGQGMQAGVPYAVDAKLTFLGDNGAALFKWTAPATVKLLASGLGPKGSEVAAFLSNGELDLLSHSGQVVQSYTYSPDALTALYLAPAGVVVQDGSSVQIRKGAATQTVDLPAKAKMIGYGQGEIFYSLAGGIHALKSSNRTDSLLVPASPGKATIAAYATAGGFAWASGSTIDWDCAACVNLAA